MHENQIIVIPPDCPVSGHAEKAFTLYYAHFNCSIFLNKSTPWTTALSPDLRKQLNDAASNQSKHFLKSSMLQVVSSSLQSIPETNIGRPISDDRTQRAYRIMKENLNSRVKNSDLARMLNMSEPSLLRMFRKAVGSTPQNELLRLRLNHASELLRTTEESIENIADACGFWDRNHFTRVFTKEWHVPPAQYRRSSTAL